MTLILSAITGAGLALACCGGLWLTVRRVARSPQARPGLVIVSSLGRLVLAAVVFGALARLGAAQILCGLGGYWVARSCLVLWLGGLVNAR